VIDRVSYFYEHENSNVHRAAHELAARATMPTSRRARRRAASSTPGSTREIVFVRGATEAINLVAQSWGRQNIQKDDEIVITWLEHHANIVPWQMLCAEKGARLRVAPVDDSGQVLLDEYEKLLGPKTRLVSITHVSNALGTLCRSRRWSKPRIVTARACLSMAHRLSRTCASMCRPSAATSTSSPGTRSLRRRASAWSTESPKCWTHASLAGRRQHDSGRHLREDALPAAAAAI
jgi:hypothetical protein